MRLPWKRKVQMSAKELEETLDEGVAAIEEAYQIGLNEGFADGYQKGYNVGRADGIEYAKEAAKKAIQRRNQHGKETSNN